MSVIPVAVQVLLALSTVVSIAVAAYVRLRRTDAPGAPALVWMLLAVALWSAAYLQQLTSPTLEGKLLWARFVATGSVASSFSYFAFVVQYTGHDDWLTRRRWIALLSLPAVAVALAWTNDLHELVWVDPRIATYGAAELLSTTKGPGFIVTLVLGYGLVLVATLMVLELAFRSDRVHRGQAVTILLAALVPWFGSGVFYGLPREATPYDPTPLLFSGTGFVLAVALHRYHMFDMVPVPPDRMIRELRDPAVVLDARARVSHLNPAARALFDVEGDLVGLDAADLFPEWSDIEADDGDHLRREELHLPVDGTDRYFDLQASPLTDHRDRSLGRLLVLRDVTERRERERTLAEYRTVFETVRDAVYVVDADGTIRLVNEPLAAMVGMTPADLQGRHVADVVDSETYESAVNLVGDLVASDRTSSVLEFELTDATGEAVPCESEVALLFGDVGVRGCVGTVRDVSRRKRVQESLEETTSTLETIFEASPLAVVTVDRSLEVTRWNPAAERILGWDADSMRGRPLPALSGPDGDETQQRCTAALGGETVTNHEQRWPTKGGVDRHVDVSIGPLETADGGVVGAVLVVADITDRKHREQQLDVLSRVLRHNLRNDMGIVLPQVKQLREELRPAERERVADSVLNRLQGFVDTAEKARRAEAVIDRGSGRNERDVATAVERTVEAGRSQYSEATFEVTVEGSGFVLAGDGLDVALTNLLENAVIHNDRPDPTVAVSVTAADDTVEVTVSDDGPGIPDEERRVLLTGEETPLHHGSGIGLWLVHWIVDRAGGELSFAANDPRGSAVTMRFPRSRAEVEASSETQP